MQDLSQGHSKKDSSKMKNSGKEETQEPRHYGTTILNLDECILIKIFLLLPAASIICCKVVCKEWYDLLSQLHFCNLYLKNPLYINLLFRNLISGNNLGKDFLISIRKDYRSSKESLSIKMLEIRMKKCLAVKGCCNGLLYLIENITPSLFPYISNPMTGEYICIPKINSSKRALCRASGFGFSKSYKVLDVETWLHPNKEFRVHCQIFTIGVDTKWRELVLNNFVACGIYNTATILNGAFHWLVDHESLVDFSPNLPVLINSICAFDIAEERFRSVPLPPGNAISMATCLSIGEIKGNLCVYDCSRSQYMFDIWMMNEYGNVGSWTRNFVLESCILSISSAQHLHLPIASWSDGEVLAISDSIPHLIWHNLREKTFEVLSIPGFESIPLILVHLTVYTPNFLPLKQALKGEATFKGKIQKISNSQGA
ncbi:hypothetical protein M9H77_08723 [Catharanthus roseus]|uniref:Uncharacterized protein n=1 Tax=Catharanthus roseus TaxID=4058 RepID=A0ACC0BZ07_CATRO|nr:hypothetical protein M9H77_08723 [Catharanthus roseus]